ncbi:MAG: serine/threonine protein kinase, partial [Myxococcales bacterium]|nr:serine/threonine protein kinase [Myxococcales bacterium]
MSDSKHNHAIGERSAGLLDIEGKIIRDSVHARLFGGEPEPHRIGGHEVKQRLGTGGMGEVYLAHNKKLGRDEAIKVLRTGDTRDSRAQKRLLSEAQALARLSHPNVVQVHGSDVTEDGGVYIVMEFIEGPTLEQWQRAKPRTWRELLAVYSAAGRGLAAAHRAGLVHRDFKPSNVLLGKDDGPSARLVKVIDFGLAIDDFDAPARGAVGAGTSLRRSTALIGTPFYLSPEQCDGDRSTLTPKSDQFSFCVALYEALYDQHPFFAPDRVIDHSRRTTEGPAASPPQPATNPSRITALIHAIRELPLREPPPQSTAPRRIFRILKRGLERKPADRYDSMDDLLKLLEREQRPAYLRGLAFAGLTGVVLGSTAIYTLANPGPEICKDVARDIGEIWNDERAAALES